MTPDEAVLMDDLMERGYTREQVALVALTLPEPSRKQLAESRAMGRIETWDAAGLQVSAERRGYLPGY